jgi:hypothetical protein
MGPKYDIRHAIQLWKGGPKIGKTSTAAGIAKISKELGLGINPFLLLFEPGSGGVECDATCTKCDTCSGTGKKGKTKCPECGGTGIVRQVIDKLDLARQWLSWFAESDDYNIGVIDTLDAMYQVVADGVCEKLGIINPTQSDHGVAWTYIFDEMRALLAEPIAAGKGLILITHIYMMDKRTKSGVTQVAVFNLSGKTKPYVAGLANQILHFDIEPSDDGEHDEHVVYAAATSTIEAGDQWGVLPPIIKLGADAESGARAILKAFGHIKD